MLDAVNYVQKNKMEKEANNLANKVGNIYMACLMLYKNIPQTEENIKICKAIVKKRKEQENEWFKWFINGGYNEYQ